MLFQKQEGNIAYHKEGNRTYAGNPLTLSQRGAQALTVLIPQAGHSPSSGASVATVLGNWHNSQPGDVAGNAKDQKGGPRETTCSQQLSHFFPRQYLE